MRRSKKYTAAEKNVLELFTRKQHQGVSPGGLAAGHVGHISAIDFALREPASASTPAGQQVAQGVVGSRAPAYTHVKVAKRTLFNAINARRKHLIQQISGVSTRKLFQHLTRNGAALQTKYTCGVSAWAPRILIFIIYQV
jgi:hypothetical protein